MLLTIIVFIITILVLVLIHEFGHFLMSKRFNIKVLEFGFGIPPRIWGKKIGETLYSLNVLPIGGFVRPLGEDDVDDEVLKNKRSFASQAVWKRIVVVVAGVAMNLFLAWLLFYIVLAAQGFKTQLPLITNHHFLGVYQTNESMVIINGVADGSPAKQAGLKEGDRVVAFNGTSVKSSGDLVDFAKQHAGEQVKLTLSDILQTKYKTVEVASRKNPPAGQGALGVVLASYGVANLNYQTIGQKILSGPIHSLNMLVYTLEVMGKLISVSSEQKTLVPVASGLGGPVAIVFYINQLLDLKNLTPIIDLVANMSLMLAFINVLPIPALDGGRLFFLVLEAISKKRIPAHIEAKVHTAGMVVLLVLFFLLTYKDIRVYILNLSPF